MSARQTIVTLSVLALAVAVVFVLRAWAPSDERSAATPEARDDSREPARDANALGGSATRTSVEPDAFAGTAAPPERVVAEGSGELRSYAARFHIASGAGADQVRWAIFRGQKLLASGSAGADGRAMFEGHFDPADDGKPGRAVELIATCAEHSPLLATLEPGERVLRFERLQTIAGACTVDGRVPDEPVELSLQCSRAFWGDEHIPIAAWKAIGGRPAYRSLETETEADGSFAFDGLMSGYAGVISWNIDEYDGPVVPVEMRDPVILISAEVAAPDTAVPLVLTRRTRLVGRVLDELGGGGVEGVTVDLHALGKRVWLQSVQTDRDGRFRVILDRHGGAPPEELDVVLWTGDGAPTGPKRVDVPPAIPASPERDLGNFRLSPRRVVDVVVRDAEGAPIAGARIEPRQGPQGRHLPVGLRRDPRVTSTTDRDGRATLIAGFDTTHVRVTALGFTARMEPIERLGDPVVVTLERGAMLDVRLVGAFPRCVVQISGSEPPFLVGGEPAWEPETKTPDWMEWGESQGGVRFHPSYANRLLLGDVRPGVPFEISVKGAIEPSLQVPALAPGERRVVRFEVGGSVQELQGRVVDPDGAPVAGAIVAAADADAVDGASADTRVTTDEDGRFFALGASAERVAIFVLAEGFVSESVRHSVHDSPLVIVLRPMRVVHARVRGPGGEPCPGARVEALLSDGRRIARVNGDGVHVLRGLPDRELTVRAYAAGVELSQTLASNATELAFDVPMWGALEVGLSRLAGELSDDAYLRVQPSDAARDAIVRPLAAGMSTSRIEALAAGEYAVEVVRLADGASESQPLSARAGVHVESGRTERTTLAPRAAAND